MLCNWESVKGVEDTYRGVKVMNFKANTWKNLIFSYFFSKRIKQFLDYTKKLYMADVFYVCVFFSTHTRITGNETKVFLDVILRQFI